MQWIIAFGVFIFLIWVFKCLNIVREYDRVVVFRLGNLVNRDDDHGLILILWPIDKMVKVSLRTVAWDVPPQDIITRDNVSMKVNAVVYFRVVRASQAIVQLENYRYAVEQLAQTTLRSVLGEVELDDLLSQREKLNTRLQTILDEHTEPWGIKVTKVEVKQVDLPQEMQRAIARQAEAERERRAKIIAADGEFQASTKLSEAAAIIQRQPAAITLRYLQTLVELGTEKNTTIVFPLPVELLAAFGAGAGGTHPPGPTVAGRPAGTTAAAPAAAKPGGASAQAAAPGGTPGGHPGSGSAGG